MIGLDAKAGAVDAVGLFGHRQADNSGRRASHRYQCRARFARCGDHAVDAGDDPCLSAVWAAFEECVQPVLRIQRIGNLGAARADATNPPVTAGCGQRVVGVDGLVRAVEGAVAEMDDPDTGGSRIEARLPDGRRKLIQCGKAQSGGQDAKPHCGWARVVMMPRSSARPFRRPIDG